MRTLPERFVVADASVTIREGRYVIPLRREGKGEVGGIVHDESGTGATIFVEPPIAIELMNQLRDLERDENREIRRILGELTARLAPLRDALAGALDALVDFDALHARARAALEWRASVPEIAEAGAPAFRLVQARHPLLLDTLDRPIVPYDLEVLAGERAIVVSGPEHRRQERLPEGDRPRVRDGAERHRPAGRTGNDAARLRLLLRRHRRRAVHRPEPVHLLGAPRQPEGSGRGRRRDLARAHRRDGHRHGSGGRGRALPGRARGVGRARRVHGRLLPPG